MKRFLVFCTICIVTACLGLLTFRFLTLEETLTVNQTTFEINIGEEVPCEIKREQIKSTTVIKYESSDPEIVDYDKVLDKFVSNGKGGKATLRIESSVRTIAPISIFVTVGDGSEACPYFIKTAEDLAKIGAVDKNGACNRKLSDCYALLNDIDLSTYNNGVWTPIGSETEQFTGTFYGKNHTISNMNVNGNDITCAGLFASIGKNSTSTDNVYSLNISKATIDGQYKYAGALAGKIDGKVRNIVVSSSSVNSALDQGSFANQSYVGQLCGQLTGQVERISVLMGNSTSNYGFAGGIVGSIESASNINAQIDRSYAEGVDVSGVGYIGGIAGLNKGAVIVNCYALAKENGGRITNTPSKSEKSYLGGLVGYVDFYGVKTAMVVDGYSTCAVDDKNDKENGCIDSVSGQLVGCLTYSATSGEESVIASKNDLLGLYYANNVGIEGLGVIKTESSESAPSTDNVSLELTKFVKNTLDTEAKGTSLTSIFSHDNGKTGNDYDSWNWEIGDVWTLTEAYPILNMSGPYFDVSGLISSTVSSNVIDSYEKLAKLRDDVNAGVCDYSVTYIIKADIQVSESSWTPIGTEANQFNGTILVAKNELGAPYKITGLNNSLFDYIGGNGKISGIVVEGSTIQNGQTVGAIANYNNGTILNCQVISSTISTDSKATNVYVGGLVGYNNNTIQNSKLVNSTVTHAGLQNQTSLYLGGIVGFNNAGKNVISCGVVSTNPDTMIGINNECNNTSYVGGIAGSNNGTIDTSYVGGQDQKVTIILLGKKSYVGGIVGINADDKAEINTSLCIANLLQGYNVCGIVANTNVYVRECSSESKVIKGHYVGGIAFQLSKGRIEDSSCTATLVADDSSSPVLTSLVYKISYISKLSKNEQPTITHCYSACSFEYDATRNKAKAYYETQPNARASDAGRATKSASVNDGYIINCIYDREAGNATRSYYRDKLLDSSNKADHPDLTAKDIVNGKKNYVKKSKSGEVLDGNGCYLDIGLTTEEINSNDNQVFDNIGFSSDIWALGNCTPTIKSIKDLKDKIGL